MIPYELTNAQRKYFGLSLVADNWDKVQLSDKLIVYWEADTIVKVLNYAFGYVENDTSIATKQRQVILPKTSKGKDKKLTIPAILKLKGSGIQFTGSFVGGGVNAYDNRRNLFFIKSFPEDGIISSYNDIDRWITGYINNVPDDYFEWLNKELSQKRLKVKVKEGDIVAFKIGHNQYGFARILLDVFAQRQEGNIFPDNLKSFHPRSLIIMPYAYYTDTIRIDVDELVNKNTLPPLCIFDLDVYRGEIPIVGHRPLSVKDKLIPLSVKPGTYLTMPYSKTEIETLISAKETHDI